MAPEFAKAPAPPGPPAGQGRERKARPRLVGKEKFALLQKAPSLRELSAKLTEGDFPKYALPPALRATSLWGNVIKLREPECPIPRYAGTSPLRWGSNSGLRRFQKPPHRNGEVARRAGGAPCHLLKLMTLPSGRKALEEPHGSMPSPMGKVPAKQADEVSPMDVVRL